MWTALEDTGMVVNVHTSVTQGVARTHYEGPLEEDPADRAHRFRQKQGPAQQFLGNMIISGNFDRHPKLKVVCAEYDVGWVANLVQQVDYLVRTRQRLTPNECTQLPPSEYFKKECLFTFRTTAPRAHHARSRRRVSSASDHPDGVTTSLVRRDSKPDCDNNGGSKET